MSDVTSMAKTAAQDRMSIRWANIASGAADPQARIVARLDASIRLGIAYTAARSTQQNSCSVRLWQTSVKY